MQLVSSKHKGNNPKNPLSPGEYFMWLYMKQYPNALSLATHMNQSIDFAIVNALKRIIGY